MEHSNTLLPVFVINLPSKSERRENVSKYFHSRELLDVEFIEAVDAKNINIDPSEYKYFLKYQARYLNLGEYACFKSHQKAMQMCIDRDLPFALILGDDAIPEGEFDTDLLDILNYCNQHDFDMINLAGIKNRAYKKIHKLVSNNQLIDYSYYPTAATGYLVSQQAAREMVKLPVLCSYDTLLQQRYVTDVNVLHLSQPIVVNDPAMESCIDGDTTSRHQVAEITKKEIGLLKYRLNKVRFHSVVKTRLFFDNCSRFGVKATLLYSLRNIGYRIR